MAANLTPQYLEAEAKPRAAKTSEEKLAALEEMWRELPKHESSEKLQADDRIQAHISVATLALFLKRSLEHQLASALPEVSGSEAIAAMRSIGLAELNLNGHVTRPVSGGSRDARVRDNLGVPEVGQVVLPATPGGLPAAREWQVNVPLTRNNDLPYGSEPERPRDSPGVKRQP